MATLKITLFFQGEGKGWTESYWRPGPGGDHEAQIGPTLGLARLRAQLLGKECHIKAYRISTEGTGPDALLKYIDIRHELPVGQAGAPVGKIPTAAQPDVALLLRCSNLGRTKHKFIYLRGIWDMVEDEHGKYKPTVAWTNAMTSFINNLEGNDWGWFGVTAKTKSRLVSATRDAKDQVTFVFTDDLIPDGMVGKRTRVRISGVNNGKSALNRTHVVEVVDRKTVKTEFTTACPNIVIGGFGAHQVYDYIDIKHADDQKIVTRECGAPLLESPGRAKARNRA